MLQARRFDGIGDKQWISRSRGRTGWKNNLSGTLGDLSFEDTPLQRKQKFNIDKELDTLYRWLLGFLEDAGARPYVIDIHMLRHALGMNGDHPVIIYSRLVHEILSREVERYNRKNEIAGTIDEVLEMWSYSDWEIETITHGFATRRWSEVQLSQSWAWYLINFIDQRASEEWYQWKNNRWVKYQKDVRFAQYITRD